MKSTDSRTGPQLPQGTETELWCLHRTASAATLVTGLQAEDTPTEVGTPRVSLQLGVAGEAAGRRHWPCWATGNLQAGGTCISRPVGWEGPKRDRPPLQPLPSLACGQKHVLGLRLCARSHGPHLSDLEPGAY